MERHAHARLLLVVLLGFCLWCLMNARLEKAAAPQSSCPTASRASIEAAGVPLAPFGLRATFVFFAAGGAAASAAASSASRARRNARSRAVLARIATASASYSTSA